MRRGRERWKGRDGLADGGTRGLHVIATARNPAVLEGMAAPLMTTLQLDVTDAASIARCRDQVAELAGGRLDILVNNAFVCRRSFSASPSFSGPPPSLLSPSLPLSLSPLSPSLPLSSDLPQGTHAHHPSHGHRHRRRAGHVRDQRVRRHGHGAGVRAAAGGGARAGGQHRVAGGGDAVRVRVRVLRLQGRRGQLLALPAPGAAAVWRARDRGHGRHRALQHGSHGHRSLPPASPYTRVRDLFERRLVWSQSHATVDTAVFAHALAAAALAPEAPLWLRGWWGRPDWFWAGGNAASVRWGTRLGEWLVDMACYRLFGLRKLEDMVNREAAAKKLR